MRTIRIKLYKFDELSEEAKQEAINQLNDINVSYEWWEFTFNDAKEIGLKITSFDLDRNRHAAGDLINSMAEVCDAIIKNHGEHCDTHKTAQKYLKQWADLVERFSDGVNINEVAEGNEYDFDQEADELEEQFLDEILEDYSIMLQHEYEYLCSDEAIIETIQANEYEFTQQGKLY